MRETGCFSLKLHYFFSNFNHFCVCACQENIQCKYRSSPPEMFLGEGVLKLFSKFTGENPCRNV